MCFCWTVAAFGSGPPCGQPVRFPWEITQHSSRKSELVEVAVEDLCFPITDLSIPTDSWDSWCQMRGIVDTEMAELCINNLWTQTPIGPETLWSLTPVAKCWVLEEEYRNLHRFLADTCNHRPEDRNATRRSLIKRAAWFAQTMLEMGDSRPLHYCWHCRRALDESKKCSSCGKARYCSNLCQQHDWHYHKIWCKQQRHDHGATEHV